MGRIKVNASNVASLIGKNPYKSREEAVNEVLLDNGFLEEDQEAIELIEEIQQLFGEYDAGQVGGD